MSAAGRWKAEYALSSRAACKACGQKIGKDELRFGLMVQSDRFDGLQPLWHHDACFFKKPKRVSSLDEIDGVDSLRWEDQKRVESYVTGKVLSKARTSADDGDTADGDDEAGTSSEDVVYEIENAKSSRAGCKSCNKKIGKGEVRVSTVDTTKKSRTPGWRHLKCFVESGCWKHPLEELPGFGDLDAEGQELVRSLSPPKAVKRKAAAEDGPEKKKQAVESNEQSEKEELEKKLEAQTKALWNLINDLKNVHKTELKEMLMLNGGGEPRCPESELRERCADGMMFGPLSPCPLCKGPMMFSSGLYKCTGYLSEWSKCTYTAPEATRLKQMWEIPEETDNKFLLQWYKKQKKVKPVRILRPKTAEAPATENKENDSSLQRLEVVLIGRLEDKTHAEWKKTIEEAGGKVRQSVAPGTVVVTTRAECEKENQHITDARGLRVPVVDERYLTESIKAGTKLPTSKFLIELNKNPELAKVLVKGRSAVDEASGLQDKGHILEVGTDIYSVTLSKSDIAQGRNSFYILQIIESDDGRGYYLFRRWGRVGDVGTPLTDGPYSKQETIHSFLKHYEEKTGNNWSSGDFKKKPGKYFRLEIDYGAGEEAPQKVLGGSKTKLHPRVVNLLKMLFDVETYKAAMLEFEINTSEMPLGKLAKRHIAKGFEVLTEIQGILQSNEDANLRAVRLSDASNRFFTLIPTVQPTVIGDDESLQAKIRMLEALRDIEIASQIINSGEEDDEEDPLDLKYKKLHCGISPLPHDGPEFQLVKKYLETTHAPTHTEWALEVVDVFEVSREGERESYTPKKSAMDNHMLLWHGSRTTNFVGILSQGLRIAPPEAPVTGYMFGKGVYFADLVSKSAQYCFTSRSNPTGLMLLSEVALGRMKELTRAQYMDKPPHGYNSTKGLGRMVPDPATFETMDNDVVVPCGKPIRGGTSGDLQYNEYIVYDTAQVNLRYLLKVQFKYKR